LEFGDVRPPSLDSDDTMLDSSQTVCPEFGQNGLILAIWPDSAGFQPNGRIPASTNARQLQK